jgi:hypothetical protein
MRAAPVSYCIRSDELIHVLLSFLNYFMAGILDGLVVRATSRDTVSADATPSVGPTHTAHDAPRRHRKYMEFFEIQSRPLHRSLESICKSFVLRSTHDSIDRRELYCTAVQL